MPEPEKNPEFDAAKAEVFAEQFVTALNYGSLCLMVSIGHRTGLFDAMSGLPPSTTEEIAKKAMLNERYVREWLGAMVTAKVVEVDPTSTHYVLPAEHAAFLTRAAGADNMAVAVMAEDSGQSVLSSLESHVLPLVPGLTDQLAAGICVLDVGCGSGRIMNRLAELYPNSRFTGMDLSPEAVETARSKASQKGLQNIEFIIRDLSNFHETAESEAFDFITTFDAVHDQAKPLNVLKGIHRALMADGLYLMQDIRGSSYVHNNIEHPFGTFLYAISTMHCITVSLAQGGEGLGAMWGEEKTREYLQKAGFRSIETNQLAHDISNNWYIVRK